MADELVISLKEQLDFVDGQVILFEEIVKVFADDKPELLAEAQLNLTKAQAVRETIHFEYLMSEIAKAEDTHWLEETVC